MSASPPHPLATTEWLAEHLGDPDLRIYDATVELRSGESRSGRSEPYTVVSARDAYDEGHVPGAAFLDLVADLSDPDSDLHFTMPGPEQLDRALSAAGLGDDHTVLLYSTSSPMWATRLWWMFRASGFENAKILDGGFPKWKAEGRPVSTEPARYAPARFRARPQPERWADRDEVRAAIDDGATCTLNALPPALHTGESDSSYGRKGRIAGSDNVPFSSLLNEDGTFRSASELSAAFVAVGALERKRVICYCGGGISATVDAFALELLGHPNVAVYDGSLSEWARHPDLPMETG